MVIYDNGGATFDRYTAVYLNQPERSTSGRMFACYGMSADPFSPLGFAQHSTAQLGKHLGRRIRFDQLPKDVQRAINQGI